VPATVFLLGKWELGKYWIPAFTAMTLEGGSSNIATASFG